MSKEKFNSLEYAIFQLIRQGKTRDEITACGLSTPANIGVALVNIFEKTEGIVPYHSARSKFKELQWFIRNNPNAFSPIPDAKTIETFSDESLNHRLTVYNLILKLENKYKQELEINRAKLAVLSDLAKELEEGE